jgi:hypothetical protein
MTSIRHFTVLGQELAARLEEVSDLQWVPVGESHGYSG